MAGRAAPKIAIVHDWLYGGGAEKVVLELHRMFPDAPIYTSYCSDEWRQRLDGTVVTGYLQWRPFAKARKFLPLLRQWWFAGLKLQDYDLIISTTGNGEAKFARPGSHAKHLCYCFTPNHFYWDKYQEYLDNPGMGKLNWVARLGLKLLVKPLRARDFRAAQRVTEFIAISTHIQDDIRQYYGRESTIVYPPVDTSVFTTQIDSKGNSEPSSGFITWGRHVPYKRLDLAVAACNELQLPFTIVGTGPETEHLRAIAGPTITFTGFLDDEALVAYARKASAFIFTSKEDFGIAPVEAMALGLPVIAYRAGGALDYVIPGKTGEFFDKQTVENLKSALQTFQRKNYSPRTITETTHAFNQAAFQVNMKRKIKNTLLS